MVRYPESESEPEHSCAGSAKREELVSRLYREESCSKSSIARDQHLRACLTSFAIAKVKNFGRVAKLGLDLVTRSLNRKIEHCVQEHRLDRSVECEIYLVGKELSCLGKLDCSCAVIHTRFAITRLMRPSNTVICLPSSTP